MAREDKFDMTLFESIKDKVYPIYLTVSKDEISIRCPFCGDSSKSEMSAHLYIKNSSPFPFFCQKCAATGFVDDKFLMKINGYDNTISAYIHDTYNDYLSGLNKKYGNSFTAFRKVREPEVLPNQIGDLEQRKLDYLENRLGKLSMDDIKDFRIILNLTDFYMNNELPMDGLTNWKANKLNELNENYVMFLLYDKNMISCRHMDPKTKEEKFYKLRIFEDTDEQSKRFFSIRNDVDLSNPIFDIHIAEGIFDICSVYINLKNRYSDSSTLYMANNGKGYLFVFDYLQSIGILNANIHIYSDNDVTIKDLKKRLRNSMLLNFNGAEVIYNIYGGDVKDFGVTADKIKESSPITLTI